MMLNEARHYSFISIKGMEGPFLILFHETAVTLHIRTEDGSELAFYFLGDQGILRRLRGEVGLRLWG
jgi:hypothetical protein